MGYAHATELFNKTGKDWFNSHESHSVVRTAWPKAKACAKKHLK
ncbi:hypothetical protein LYNGBM3L_16180 [Moorena producens 3L]|uniref:Uncharacterized protein n=1 Tax=Moorena producens 3L TaxID=489825 RepID=F4XLW3_9CYAN|nr:hypothetical protein LYNGBM3L_16180 [Moorena producens 3L]